MMKSVLAFCFICLAAANAQEASPAMAPEEIIRQVAAKEKEFKRAREDYIWTQNVRVMEVDGDVVGGKHEITFDVLFSPTTGKRIEKVTYAPQATLRRISMTAEDERDIREIQPFVLTSDELPKYDTRYLGRQKVDEVGTYVFFVRPKQMLPSERYYEGQIWVDDRDLQIVKTYGKAVPDIRKKGNENLFPRFETYREQVDGKYWFPTYTRADDTLNFSTGPVRIRIIVKYSNYQRFKADTRITFGDVVDDSKKPEVKKKPQ
jgi:hypothetical protein